MTIFSEHNHISYRSRLIGGAMLGLTALTLVGCGSKDGASNASSASQVTSSQVDPSSPSVAGHDRSSTTSEQDASSSSVVASSTSQERASRKQEKVRAKERTQTTATSQTDLAQKDYQSGRPAFVDINNGKSTLNPASWKVNNVDYANLDGLNRTSTGNTAYLESHNVANDSLRTSQTFQPTGYKQKFVDRQPILNRGHEIAYSLSKGISSNGRYEPQNQSGDQNNPKNLFAQTAFSNQKVQTIYESKVRNALKQGKKVIYQVQPIFQGDDLMAKGVHMQAISTDQTLDYNVYLYNVQPGMKFDYATGSSQVDRSMNVPTPAGAPSFHDDKTTTRDQSTTENTGKKHHYVRDAAIAGTAHHFVKKHYQKKYGGKTSHHTVGKAVVGGIAIHEAHKHL